MAQFVMLEEHNNTNEHRKKEVLYVHTEKNEEFLT